MGDLELVQQLFRELGVGAERAEASDDRVLRSDVSLALRDMVAEQVLRDVDADEAVKNFRKAVDKGVLKVMTKMGISTLHSYRGAQIFEAIGLNREVIDHYFTWTASRIEGVGLDVLAGEAQERHDHAYKVSPALDGDLWVGGQYQWRRRVEITGPVDAKMVINAFNSGADSYMTDFEDSN